MRATDTCDGYVRQKKNETPRLSLKKTLCNSNVPVDLSLGRGPGVHPSGKLRRSALLKKGATSRRLAFGAEVNAASIEGVRPLHLAALAAPDLIEPLVRAFRIQDAFSAFRLSEFWNFCLVLRVECASALRVRSSCGWSTVKDTNE